MNNVVQSKDKCKKTRYNLAVYFQPAENNKYNPISFRWWGSDMDMDVSLQEPREERHQDKRPSYDYYK